MRDTRKETCLFSDSRSTIFATALAGLLMIFGGTAAAQKVPVTQVQYLSGHGCDDMVQWDFQCTGGNNSGKWGKIGVPSCWELQGYGTYQYGMKFYGKAFPEGIADEKGLYKYEFNLPSDWTGKQIELVFEASMTDTEVKINGRKAGSKHQGAFYRFSYNVSDRVFFGNKKNVLEVTVSKESENVGVNLSERRADYWNFGGIFRPVFITAKPAQNIDHFAIDAQGNGAFKTLLNLNMAMDGAKVKTEILDKGGKVVGQVETPVKPGSDWCEPVLTVSNAAQWNAETPNLYTARFTLYNKAGAALHQVTEKFGFRTIEVRPSDGLYINGVRVNIRGVNRHSFRPESGRTLSWQKNLEDVKLIKSMNMNSVRLSHYPADPEFFAICDSLGLYVMDELSGWHGHHETAVGVKLVEEMVMRDVNHPSIVWWSNGNEKGWNDELNGEFHKYDPQKRPVIHPQGNFSGFETMHYRSYGESQNYMRKPEIFMPTEFLHGLYDGGHGAGLYDYWEMMRKHPRCIGGFLWVLADEGVKRVDMNGFIDNVGNYGADGIVGPHHEKEGSYYTIKEVWCPVQIMNKTVGKNFDGVLQLENRYDFLNLNTCTFTWKQVLLPSFDHQNGKMQILKQGTLKGANIAPHGAGTLTIPSLKGSAADALLISVTDKYGEQLFEWSFPLTYQQRSFEVKSTGSAPSYTQNAEKLTVKAGKYTYLFDTKTGYLQQVEIGNRVFSLGNGPRVIACRRGDRSLDQFYNHDDKDARSKERVYEEFPDAGVFSGFTMKPEGSNLVVTAGYKLGNLDEARWTLRPDGTAVLDYTYNFSGVVDLIGVHFDYPEDKVVSKRWVGDGAYRVWQNRLQGPQYGLWENDYNDPIPGESFTYPEFKGFFAHVDWMNIRTKEGSMSIKNEVPDSYVGVYQPRDGRDRLLYTFPDCGISVLNVIPPVRNKVNTTDLIGPSSQPKWVDGARKGRIVLTFE